MQVQEYVSMFAQQLCCLYHAGVILHLTYDAYLIYNYVMKCVCLLHKDLLRKQLGWFVFWVQNERSCACEWCGINGVYALHQQGAPVKDSLAVNSFYYCETLLRLSHKTIKINYQIRDHLTWLLKLIWVL